LTPTTDETITNDEQDYDEISASNFLKEVFRDTSTNAELMALYKSAAGLCFRGQGVRYTDGVRQFRGVPPVSLRLLQNGHVFVHYTELARNMLNE
jgi:hypothetical protein